MMWKAPGICGIACSVFFSKVVVTKYLDGIIEIVNEIRKVLDGRGMPFVISPPVSIFF